MSWGLERTELQHTRWDGRYRVASTSTRLRVLGLHVLPGLLAYAAIRFAVPTLVIWTGYSHAWVQLTALVTMALLWELAMPFVWLRREGLKVRESLEFLGLTSFDWIGVFVLAPIAAVLLGIVGFPYLAYGYEPLRAWLDQWSPLHMPEWHILYYGYYNFPPLPLAIVLIANFIGEEVYFRGYLLRRLECFGEARWLVSNALFCLYHVWQAPVNWAYLPIAFLLPFAPLMLLRRSLWVPIAFHLLVNFDVTDETVAWLSGQ